MSDATLRILPFTPLLFDFTMLPNLLGFLLDVLRNPVAAVGLPLTLGFLSGLTTKKAINGIWYQVRALVFDTVSQS